MPFYLHKYFLIVKAIMFLALILFLIGILGFVLNRKNIILMLISIEIMLLAITFLILISSINFNDIFGQTFAIYIITIAGAESAIGLGILVAFYRLNHSLHYLSHNSSRRLPTKGNSLFTKGTINYSTKAYKSSNYPKNCKTPKADSSVNKHPLKPLLPPERKSLNTSNSSTQKANISTISHTVSSSCTQVNQKALKNNKSFSASNNVLGPPGGGTPARRFK